MKKSFIILVAIFFTHFAFAQSHSIVGAWYWSDSSNATSFFFDKDGGVSMHSGLKNSVILEKNLKKGKYDLKGTVLVITWSKSNVETNKIKFIDENSFEITFTGKQHHKNFIFKRVVDEEVIEEKVQ